MRYPVAYLETKLSSLDGSNVSTRTASDDHQVQLFYEHKSAVKVQYESCREYSHGDDQVAPPTKIHPVQVVLAVDRAVISWRCLFLPLEVE